MLCKRCFCRGNAYLNILPRIDDLYCLIVFIIMSIGDVSMDNTPSPAKKIKTEPVVGSEDVVLPASRAVSMLTPPVWPKDPDTVPTPPPLISTSTIADQLLSCEQRQCDDLSMIPFSPPVKFIYNPLTYAKETHTCYVHCYGNSKKKVLFLGMNPGPFGMAQNGVGISTMIE